MYRGFKIKFNKKENVEFLSSPFEKRYYINKGRELYSSYQNEIKYTLDSFILDDGTIDGSKMQENWFSQIEADVFISHSHKDEEDAIAFAGWLYEKFNLIAFIDSCIWGYSDKLLNTIDKLKCSNGNGNYDYDKRNRSTSIVHMMLSTALTMMIDNTETIFLLNTNNAINTSSVISDTTNSPWLYSEITISKLIQKKEPKRHYRRTVLFSKALLDSLNENVIAKFEVDTEHLDSITEITLNKWVTECNLLHKKYQYSLDALYYLRPPKKL